MAGLDASSVKTALNDFLKAPTKDHKDVLLTAADGYRENWIEAKSAGGSVPPARTAPPRRATTTYEREIQVRRDIDGIPVRLALQKRTSEKAGATWWTLSWRTNLKSSGRNRRFYFSDGDFWHLPGQDALELMQDLDARGGLDRQFFDHRHKGECIIIVSTALGAQENAERLAGMTAPDEDWGDDPFYVIASDPNGNWQKVMLVNRETRTATFRSITTDPKYRPKKDLRPGEDWWLDNSMMDANVQQTQQFLKHLQ